MFHGIGLPTKPSVARTVCKCISAYTYRAYARRRLLDLGLIEHTKVMCLGLSPLGDPAAYLIRGAVIAIRAKDSQNILVKSN